MTRRSTSVALAQRIARLALLAALSACLLQLAGCAEMQMGKPKATMENATAMRGAGFATVDVGRFMVDEAKGAGMDRGVSIRSNELRSPVDGSFAQYLRETLRVELASAGLLDSRSETVVTGILSDSEVNAPVGIGTASLGARFVVTRAGTIRFDKQLGVSAKWDSPFLGVSAIPQAAGQYEALYRKLVGALLADPSFRSAVREH